MVAHLSSVPGHKPGAASPETTKWPWRLTAGEIITRHPRTGATGEWHVTGTPAFTGYDTVVTCELPGGGESVLRYTDAEKATIRGGTPKARYSDAQRDEAIQVLNCGDRAYIALYLRRYHPEIFDQAMERITRRAAAEQAAKETTS